MNFVDKEHGAASLCAPRLRLDDHRTHTRHSLGHRRERDELAVGVARDQPAERRLAGAGRAPEEHRADGAGFDFLAEGATRGEEVTLADDFVEGARAHPRGEGLGRRGGVEESLGSRVSTRSFH